MPEKLFREWKALFTGGRPIYEPTDLASRGLEVVTPEMILEEERMQLLDEGDFIEYKVFDMESSSKFVFFLGFVH